MIKEGIEGTGILEIESLNQFVRTLEDSFKELEIAYEKKDFDNFNRLKKLIIQIQREIFKQS
ncbi:MAG: hypothetical protein ABIH65_00710 [Nanoarchaeota archaeon]